MLKKLLNHHSLLPVRYIHGSKIHSSPPTSAQALIRRSDNVSHLCRQKEDSKPPQLIYLPPFPGHPLPGRKSNSATYVTAISWLKYYFDDIHPHVIQTFFNRGLVHMECLDSSHSSGCCVRQAMLAKKVRHNEVMEVGARISVPVSIAESQISKRFDVIPSGTLYPNADEIDYLQRIVKYKDSAVLVLNKPPKLPVKGNLPVHNSMDALAAAALSYDYDEGPKLVHRLDRESSGLLLFGRTKESIFYLQQLFNGVRNADSMFKVLNCSNKTVYQRYWALVIGSPKQPEGLICAPLTKVLVDDGETDRVILAHNSGLEASQEAITEYRVLGPMINGCSWIELCPRTSCRHQLRVHCAEALGTPIVGDYRYGWFVHRRWKQMPRVDFEPNTGEPYRLKRPEGLDVQRGSVLSKVPLLHLHCREMVLPNIAKLINLNKQKFRKSVANSEQDSKPDILRIVAPMPSHMKISWNLMSSYLV
ncbi:RNA pseudouridine synthase 3, mitochondrial isoform X2 [Henckelia pumila]|uniref:RNA pseudouridine synthase 3, mitochondrial isoform X2 n=1 Tax=Henckelia pumila TaxID=405737 RepID=UPI003C6E6E03